MTVVRKQNAQRTCAICHRTLLMGERTVRFTPGSDDWVDVCALCTTAADDHGWVKEGSPTTPIVPETRRRRRFGGLAALLETRRAEPEPREEPMYRRLSPEEQAVVQAADLFNESAYCRTIAGIAKSLGDARVSLLRGMSVTCAALQTPSRVAKEPATPPGPCCQWATPHSWRLCQPNSLVAGTKKPVTALVG